MAPVRNVATERAAEVHGTPPLGKPHSVALPGSEKPGRTAIYRHWKFQNELLKTLDPSVLTIHDAFESAAKAVPKSNCLGRRPWDPVTKTFGDYIWETYETIQKRRAHLGAGLIELHENIGITGRGYGVGLWCQNRPEWQITDLACMSQDLFSVSIYDTLGPDATEYIINHADLRCVVTSLNHVATLLRLKPRLPNLKFIISLDPLSAGELPGQSKAELLNALANDWGVKIYCIQDVEAIGEKSGRLYHPPKPDSIITINYTSGTTGDPKGVVLTHASAVAATSATLTFIVDGKESRLLSFLPLAHIYQRVTEHTSLWMGGSIGYFHGNILELVEDLKLLKPTEFNAVPRLFNRFAGAIKEATLQAPGFRGALSRHVITTKLANINKSEPGVATNKHAFYDRLWARKVASAVGLEQCRTICTGSAPLDPSLHQFLRVVFSNHFFQGYGLTETYASSLAQTPGDFSSGNCGPVAPSTEACLLDVPDMEYFSTDKPYPRGELLIRSNSLFREYFRNEAETKKAIDEDGWFHTGDIFEIDELGRFKMIDRVKNVLKLSQGEYVSPERIENVFLANCPWLATAFVHGDSNQSSLVAIFGIAPEGFASFAGKALGRNISPTDIPALEEVIKEKKVEQMALKELERVAKKNKFNKFEHIRAVRLFIEPFTIENQLLTPTLKLKRPQSAKQYRSHIDQMYEEALSQEETKKAKL